MRHISGAGINLIKGFESFSSIIYICAAGFKTIYYGHLVRSGEIYDGSVEDGEKYLRNDLLRAQTSVLKNIKVPLENFQFDALTSWTFNLGGGALQRSTMRMVLNRGDYDKVPGEMMKWVWAGGRKLKGLIRRRRAEADLYLNGQFAF